MNSNMNIAKLLNATEESKRLPITKLEDKVSISNVKITALGQLKTLA